MTRKETFSTARLAASLCIVGGVMMAAAPAFGQAVLNDRANLARINYYVAPGTLVSSNPVGLYDLERNVPAGPGPVAVDHLDDMVTQWFWYRVGNGTAKELGNTVGQTFISATPQDRDFDPGNDRLSVVYEGDGLRTTVRYDLTGTNYGSFTTGLKKTVIVQNISGNTINDVNYFSVTEMNQTRIILSPAGDSPQFDPDTFEDAKVNEFQTIKRVTQTDVWDGNVVSQAMTNASASLNGQTQFEVGSAAGIRSSLNTVAGYDLNGNKTTGPQLNDLGTAFQYTFNLGAGQTFSFVEQTSIIPEPVSMAMLGLGAGLLAMRRRRA